MPDVRAGYAKIAAAYADSLSDELAAKPLDRALLDTFAEQTRGSRVVEIGCGPGQVARYLHARGASIEGIDLSPEMIDEARRRNPTAIAFHVADMLALPYPDESVGGIVAFYAIVHHPTTELPSVFREVSRVLRPEGLALIAFHIGAETNHVDSLFGLETALDFVFHPVADVEDAMRGAGLAVRATLVREPYEGAEHPSRRAYILARRA